MKIAEIYPILDCIAPFEDAEDWDNSGILIGDLNSEFDQVILSLDLDSNIIKNSPKNTLFITHHPLIFKGLKKLDGNSYPSNLIYQLIKNDNKLISMHTNFDKHQLNKFVLTEILGYENFEQINEFILKFEVNLSFEEFSSKIKNALKIPYLRVSKAHDFIKTAAICTGSGADLIATFKADCFLSGDFKYHTAFEALENQFSLIDIEHYFSEIFFGECLAKNLKNKGIYAKIANSVNPFTYL